MRILYLSQYFPPETGATQARAYEMAYNWVRLGHSVAMLTEIPNHPSGIIHHEYKGKLFEKSKLDGIEVLRVWVKASPHKTFLNRMLFYLSYMVNAFLAGIFFTSGKFDLIYATSPPLFVGGAALVISHIKQIPMIFEVRDLWPESAVALGELTNRRAISIATKLENMCYEHAIQIIVMTEGNFHRLQSRGVPTRKLYVLPNGANVNLFSYNLHEREKYRKNLGLEGKFVAIYAGIHGLAQGLDMIIEVARLLKDHTDIHIVMIGEGPTKSEIVNLAQSYELSNITFLHEIPREEVPGYLSMADIALVPLKKAEIFKVALPSKIFDAWACARPILISIDGEARDLVEKINGGKYVIPGEPSKWADAILEVKMKPLDFELMGENGLHYTQQFHSRQALAEKLINHIEKVLLNDIQ